MRGIGKIGRPGAVGARAVLAALAAALVLALGSAVVQGAGVPPSAPPPPAASAAAAAPPPLVAGDLEPPGGVYVYEVRGRRDPFRSLLVRKQVERTGITGIAGMLVDELELQGTIKTKQGWIAMMRGTDNKSYLVKKGTSVFDGEVAEIGPNQVTFRQNVSDPTNPKPFRDVVKSLSLQQKP